MYCAKCGKELKDTAKFCIYCGAKIRKSKSKRSVLRKVLLAMGGVLLLAVLALGFISWRFLSSFEDPVVETFEKKTTDQVILMSDKVQIVPGEETEVALTVYLDEDLLGQSTDESEALTIAVKDAASDEVITSFTSDTHLAEEQFVEGYVAYETSIQVSYEEAQELSWMAVADEEESAPISLTVADHITMDELEDCVEIALELKEYVEKEKLEELDDEECLQRVLEWLLADDRIGSAAINEASVLYATVDHVAGIYQLPAEEGMLGSAVKDNKTYEESGDVKAVYDYYCENGQVSASGSVYLDGLDCITDNYFMVLSSTQDSGDDSDVAWATHRMLDIANEYNSLGFSGRYLIGTDVLSYILDGGLSSGGIITLNTHGGTLKRSDGSYVSTYLVAYIDHEEANAYVEELSDGVMKDLDLGDGANFADYFRLQDANAAENYMMSVSGDSIHISSNLIMRRYQNSFFDNTIFYFGSCYGLLDSTLPQFMLSHGAKCVMGFQSGVGVYDQDYFAGHVFNVLSERKIGGNYKSLSNLGQGIGGWAKWLTTSPTDHIYDSVMSLIKGDDYMKEIPDGTTYSLYIAYNQDNFALKGNGDLDGKVVVKNKTITYDKDGNSDVEITYENPDDVELTMQHFLNQDFEKSFTRSADSEGNFTMEELPWGVYGIDIKGDEIVDDTAGVVHSGDRFDGGEITVDAYGAKYSQYLMIEGSDGDEPVKGADITLTSRELLASEDANKEVVLNQVTGADGQISFTEIPGGLYTMTIVYEDQTYEYEMVFENGTTYIHKDPIYLDDDLGAALEAYAKLLREQYENGYYNFCLVNVDNNKIPELVVCIGMETHIAQSEIYTYYKGEVQSLEGSSDFASFYYSPGNGILISSVFINGGFSYQTYYQLEKGETVPIRQFYYSAGIYTENGSFASNPVPVYKIDEATVSESEYNTQLKDLANTYSTYKITGPEMYKADESHIGKLNPDHYEELIMVGSKQ